MLVIQFKYFYNYKALWTVDYVQNLNPGVIPYDDENEDQNLQPGDILNYEYKDELSLDNWVYDKLLPDDIQNHGGVELPLKDLYVLGPCHIFESLIALQFWALAWLFLR